MTKSKAVKQFSREDILAKLKNQIIVVEIPEWGATIRVQPVTFDRMIAMKTEHPIESDFKAALVVACCVDLQAEDVRLMKEGNGFQFATLSQRVYAALDASIAPGN
jgi:hypothetical protein